MRLFIALDVNSQIIQECERLQAMLPHIGISKTQHYHITLKFLGEVQPDVLEKIKSALAGIKAEKFTLRTTTIGIFPSEEYIRVIWIGFAKEEKIFLLEREINAALNPLGCKQEKAFQPHITLARVKSINNRENLLRAIRKAEVQSIETSVVEFVLYQSIRIGKNQQYKPLLKVQLR